MPWVSRKANELKAGDVIRVNPSHPLPSRKTPFSSGVIISVVTVRNPLHPTLPDVTITFEVYAMDLDNKNSVDIDANELACKAQRYITRNYTAEWEHRAFDVWQ